VYTAIYNILPYNKIVNVHDYIEYGAGKVRKKARSFCATSHVNAGTVVEMKVLA
jgi:hypothetical protein